MKTNKKQRALMALITKCGYLLRNEVNKQQYPDSMINAMVNKGSIHQDGNVLTVKLKG